MCVSRGRYCGNMGVFLGSLSGCLCCVVGLFQFCSGFVESLFLYPSGKWLYKLSGKRFCFFLQLGKSMCLFLYEHEMICLKMLLNEILNS